jgi:hypothetical protein
MKALTKYAKLFCGRTERRIPNGPRGLPNRENETERGW